MRVPTAFQPNRRSPITLVALLLLQSFLINEYNYIFVNNLGSSLFTTWSLLLFVGYFFEQCALLGRPWLAVAFINRFIRKKQPQKLVGFTLFNLYFTGMMALIFVMLLLGLGLLFETTNYLALPGYWLWLLLWLSTSTVATCLLFHIIGFGFPIRAFFVKHLLSMTVMVVTLLVMTRQQASISLSQLIPMWACIEISALLILSIMLRAPLQPLLAQTAQYQPKEWILEGLSSWTFELAILGTQSISFFLDWLYDPQSQSAAVYAELFALSTILLRIFRIFVLSWGLKLIAQALTHAQTQRALNTIFISLTPIALGIFAFIAFFGHPILRLFGAAYDAYYPALLLLLGGYCFHFITGISSSILKLHHQDLWVSLAHLTLVLMVVGLSLSLIPIYGLYGAILALVVPIVVIYILFTLKMSRLGYWLYRPVRLSSSIH